MYRFVRIGDVAIKLRLRDPLGGEAERPRIVIARLPFALREINGPPVDPAGRPGLESRQLETTRSQAIAQRLGRRIPCPAPARLRLTHVHQRLEKRTGRENNA